MFEGSRLGRGYEGQGFEPDATIYNSLMSVFSTMGRDQVKSYVVEMQNEAQNYAIYYL